MRCCLHHGVGLKLRIRCHRWLAFYLLFILFGFLKMWTAFKVFIEFATVLLLFYVLVFWPKGMWDLSSLTKNRACTPALGGEVLATGLPGNSLTRSEAVFCRTSLLVLFQPSTRCQTCLHPIPRGQLSPWWSALLLFLRPASYFSPSLPLSSPPHPGGLQQIPLTPPPGRDRAPSILPSRYPEPLRFFPRKGPPLSRGDREVHGLAAVRDSQRR